MSTRIHVLMSIRIRVYHWHDNCSCHSVGRPKTKNPAHGQKISAEMNCRLAITQQTAKPFPNAKPRRGLASTGPRPRGRGEAWNRICVSNSSSGFNGAAPAQRVNSKRGKASRRFPSKRRCLRVNPLAPFACPAFRARSKSQPEQPRHPPTGEASQAQEGPYKRQIWSPQCSCQNTRASTPSPQRPAHLRDGSAHPVSSLQSAQSSIFSSAFLSLMTAATASASAQSDTGAVVLQASFDLGKPAWRWLKPVPSRLALVSITVNYKGHPP